MDKIYKIDNFNGCMKMIFVYFLDKRVKISFINSSEWGETTEVIIFNNVSNIIKFNHNIVLVFDKELHVYGVRNESNNPLNIIPIETEKYILIESSFMNIIEIIKY